MNQIKQIKYYTPQDLVKGMMEVKPVPIESKTYQNYQRIAEKYLEVVQNTLRLSIEIRRKEEPHKIYLQGINEQCRWTYVINGKEHLWRDYFRKEFPLYKITMKGTKPKGLTQIEIPVTVQRGIIGIPETPEIPEQEGTIMYDKVVTTFEQQGLEKHEIPVDTDNLENFIEESPKQTSTCNLTTICRKVNTRHSTCPIYPIGRKQIHA